MMKYAIYIILLLMIAGSVKSYDYVYTKNVSVLITPGQVLIQQPDNSFKSYDTVNVSSYVMNWSFIVTVDNPYNVTENISLLLNNLHDRLVNDIRCENATARISSGLINDINNNISTSVKSTLETSQSLNSDSIVTRVNDYIGKTCNTDKAVVDLKSYMSSTLIPNITEYNSMVERLNAVQQSYTTQTKDMDMLRADYDRKDSQITWMSWSFFIMVALFLVMLYFDYGSPGRDLLRRARWRRTETTNVNNTAAVDNNIMGGK